nr:T9SS type A sorting domain-containing protein [uncultured Arsenicibacter sp.]
MIEHLSHSAFVINLVRRWAGQGFFVCLFAVATTLSHAQTSGQVVQLPFFDDFSTVVNNRPDPKLWQSSSVYINNTMGINHPSVNVATFDGLAPNGLPYTLTDRFAAGSNDTLQSQPINLGGLAPADSVYLSFYWQIRGLGELPDEDDTLKLEMRNNLGVWETVWYQYGGRPDNNFRQAFVSIRATKFLYGTFQFRFRAIGRSSGAYDTWNIDYIYLNSKRSLTDRYIRDIATRQAVGPSFLKRYTAMPLNQYLINPAAETADSIRTDIVNLFNNFNFTSFRFTTRELVTGRLIQDTQTQSKLIPSLNSQVLSARLTPVTGTFPAGRVVLKHTFDVLTTDDQNPSIPTVNLRRNDTISGVTVLDNYYAYDDGSAESATQIGRLERWAVRFVLNKADLMSGVYAYIMPFNVDQTGQQFTIRVYANDKGKPGTELYYKTFAMQYPPARNGFVEFKFDRQVALTDTFFVGYQQISEDELSKLRLGLDKNSPFGSELFYRAGPGTDWIQNLKTPQLALTGAFMIRPIMGGKGAEVVLANPEEETDEMKVYPNPTSGRIAWKHPAIKKLELFDLNGRSIHVITPASGQQTADLPGLPTGMYLIRMSNSQRSVVQRLLIN